MDTQKIDNAVEHPTHYNQYPIEVIDIMERVFGREDTEKWCLMTAFKYRMRMGLKAGAPMEQDLEKEQWYLRKAEELKKKVGGQEIREAYTNPVSIDAIMKLDAIKKAYESSHNAEIIVNRIYDVLWGEK